MGLACLFATYFVSLFVFPCPCLTPFPWCCVRGRRPPAVGVLVALKGEPGGGFVVRPGNAVVKPSDNALGFF